MSGLYGTIGTSFFAPAAAALPGGHAARTLRGSPSASLTLSAALHLMALALLLFLHGRNAIPEPPKIEIRTWPMPAPYTLPPIDPATAPASEGSADPRGIPDPREAVAPVLPEALPGGDGPIVPDRSSRGIPPAGAPGDANPVSGGQPPADQPSVFEEPPRAIYAPDPEYPPIAREAGIEGKVIVEALVGQEGTVRQTRVRQGNPILAESAEVAVRRWRFRPAQWNGKPVTAWVAIPVDFRLR